MLVKSRATRRALREQRRGLKASVGVIVTFRKDLLARWPLLLGALACSLAFAGARLLEPWPLKYIFDNVLAERPLDTPIPGLDGLLADSRMRILAAATIAILVLATLRGIFFAYQTLLTTSVGQDVVLKLRRKVFAKLQQLSPDFHAKNSTGDLLTRLTGDVSALRELLVGALLGILSEGLVLIGFLVVMLLMEWRLAVIAIVAMPLVFGLVTLYSGRIRAATRKQRQAEGELAGRLQEVLSGIHLVQLFAREDEENERLRRLNKRSLRSGMESARLEANLNRSVEISIALTTALTLWFGATQVIAGRMTPGDLIVFIAYMQSFYRPLKRISRVARRASKAAVSVERIMEVLEREPDVRDGTVTAPRFAGEIRLEGVEFSYGEGAAVLCGVDLTVQPGQTVALVGRTGAGKTTLLGLIPRMHDASSGAVRIDGLDVRELTLKSLRDQISVVPQNGMLFGGTVRENIAYGKPDATDAEIEAAARAALIHDVVLALPDGYGTVLGERGVTFSGGERQRLAIARAIVKDAPIVLLDEPTTGLDAGAERFVVAALERLLEGRTAIVIAHRLSTIRRADVIVVLQAGSIVERGDHGELLAAGGAYSRLHELQSASGSGRLLGLETAAAAASSIAPARQLAGSATAAAAAAAAKPTLPVRELAAKRAWRRLLTSLVAKILAVTVLGGALAAATAFGIDRLTQPDRAGQQARPSGAGSGAAVPARAGRKQATGDDGRSVRTTADRPRTSAAAGERVAAGASRKPPAPRRSFSGPRSGAASLTRLPGAEAKSSAAPRVEPARARGSNPPVTRSKGHQPSPSEQVQNPPIAPAIPATPDDDPDDRSGPSANEAERDADSSKSGPGSSGAESSGSGDEDEDADGRGRGSGS